MALFLPVNFAAALMDNRHGQLSAEQRAAIDLMYRNRGVVGLIIFSSAFFIAAISILAAVLPASPGEVTNIGTTAIIGGMGALALLDSLWGLWIYRAAKKERTNVAQNASVQTMTGRPNKYNYGMPIKLAGATHTMMLRHGWISVNGESCGVIPGELYQNISDQTEGTFYYITTRVPGFKKRLVVNYEV